MTVHVTQLYNVTSLIDEGSDCMYSLISTQQVDMIIIFLISAPQQGNVQLLGRNQQHMVYQQLNDKSSFKKNCVW